MPEEPSEKDVHLSPLERDVHGWVVEHADAINDMTIREVASATYSNTTTILRYTRKLGYKGFNDFKTHIWGDLQHRRLPSTIVQPTDSAVNVINKMRMLNIQTIEKMSSSVSLEQLDRIVRQIEHAQQIDFLAYDANAALADYASHYFFQVGKICSVYTGLDEQLTFAQRADATNRVVFLISRNGSNRRLLSVLQELDRRHVGAILLCGNPSSPACKLAGEVVACEFVDSFQAMGDCLFYVSAKYALDLIVNLYYSRNYREVSACESAYTQAYNELEHR